MAAIDWTREVSPGRGGGGLGAIDDAAPLRASVEDASVSPAAFTLPARYAVTDVRTTGAAGGPSGAPAAGGDAYRSGAAVAQDGPRAGAQPLTGGFSMNLATGQDASGAIQTTGDLADAHWTVSNADTYKHAPIAYTVAPGDADWYSGWFADGPNSSWIAANPDNSKNGLVTYTITFDLTGYNPADATLMGGQFAIDDQGVVMLNGHQLGSSPEGGWGTFHALSNGAGDFVAGVNTLVIETTASDHFLEGARFEGTVVDTVTTNPPGPIHWASAVNGNFTTATDWTGGLVPAANNDAILDASGTKAYTVTSAAGETVESIQTAANATLAVTAGDFQALTGTGAGANAGTIEVSGDASLSMGGAVDNAGLISLAGNLVIATSATLSGAGQITMTDSAGASITGGAAAATLTNLDNTISGAGTIGSATLTLVNGAAGVIDASGAAALTLASGADVITNAGLIEATGAGGLILQDVTLDGSAGGALLTADGSLAVLHGAALIGGELESAGSGLIRTAGRANTLDGTASTVTNAATLRVANHTALTLEGAIDNTGHIEVRSFGGPTTLVIGAAGATLSGGGRVTTDDNARNAIVGANASATLTNVDNTIAGAGALGGGKMTLVNEAAGVIDGDYAVGLTIDTGANAVTNAGLIEATGGGVLTIESALDNTGTLFAFNKGVLTLDGDVSGAGTAKIRAGTLDALGAFTQDVTFAGWTGALGLAQSQSYTGSVSGFSRKGATSLDLGDIAFVGSSEATWSGGVLTVTDGTHAAHITLVGDFAHQTFVASDDGHGGTLVVATTPGARPPADAQPLAGGLSLNLATGQDASGAIQTTGDLADAHWTVSNSDNYKSAPIAFTVAPGEADWYTLFHANGPNSSWIAADPDNIDNGEVTYTITFDLTGYNPADAALVGGQFDVGDAGTVYLNGHVIGSEAYNQFINFNSLSSGAGDFVAGVNTLVIQTTMSDKIYGAARFEGTVVDTVTTNPPGPDHWAKAVSGDFATAKAWSGSFVPSSNNDAILDAAGTKSYMVTSATDETVESIQTAPNATLAVTAGVFQTLTGTGAGANAGAIEVSDAATLEVGGSVANSGLIALAGGLLVASDVTLSGDGQLAMNDGATGAIAGGASATTLTNLDNTISGAGLIGSPTLTLVNGAAGVIDASGTNTLTIATGANPLANAGLIEATGAGGLTLENETLDDSAGGTLLAGDGSRVILHDATLIGGDITSVGSGLIRTAYLDNTLDGTVSTLTNAGVVRVADHSRLTLEGAIDNTGHIEVRSFGGQTTLMIGAAGATLSGGGLVTTDDNAEDSIVGASAAATLTNVDNTIMGAGALGGGKMTLVNEAAGVIDGAYAAGLTIDTGANAVTNAGLIEATRGGVLTIESALDNTGTLLAKGGGVLTLEGGVTGAGTATIRGGGTLDAAGAFSQDVAFVGGAGALGLAQSQSYAGTVSGFSRKGATSLDLGDIAFVGSGEATWRKGVLTVTDGTHTATIALVGNFGGQTFVASDDGHGGTMVIATTPGAQAPAAPAHRFAAAMAGLAHPATAATAASTPGPEHLFQALASPRLRHA